MLKEKYTFEDLLDIMKTLRSENGCPWDREQTHESLKRYVLEETYEVMEQIDAGDKDKLCDELGDLLLQIVFHGQIGEEEGTFTTDDILTAICKKMIMRHTHVFGSEKADTADDVLRNWEEIKKKEKGVKTQTEVLKDVPKNLPALVRGYKVQEKASQVGFDWDNIDDVFKKVDEEVEELKVAYKSGDLGGMEEELGDSLFSLVNLARFIKVQPEMALTSTINKFIKRFNYVEEEATKQGKSLKNMSLAEMDVLWNEAKNK